ncbi:membrane protein insertase YidC [Sphingomonas cannabina]|uniref:membrane protein insertase YidC n=1 Tax=Sphingomonas cannabina TaxID=2899123 RepID=UPI001F3CCA80|nr:membrane protein insertase YidC [Sphingomonas cannabina]UIJ44386.1 membrane protein insertase YidC [Sphingomonas cannabina]
MKEDQKNFVLFAVIAALLLFAWPWVTSRFFPSNPPVTKIEGGKTKVVTQPGATPAADSATALRDRQTVLREAPRVRIDTPTLSGSINLKGARFDDLVLKTYKETIAKNSPPIRLLSPSGAQGAYFAGFGWRGSAGLKVPDANTVWHASGDLLAPGKPVTLEADNGQGQRFRIELAVDDQYMFIAKQSVLNGGAGTIAVAPYGYLSRSSRSADVDQWVAHVGPMAVRNGSADYVDWKEVDKAPSQYTTTGGWAGFTDHYWLAALVPDQKTPVDIQLRSAPNGGYQADFAVRDSADVAPGKAITQTSRFFAGAKEVKTLEAYEQSGIVQFDRAIDWGWFAVIEKPMFYYLDWLFRAVGNFGVAIILLTLTIRALLFPIAQRQFASMASMRAIQPKMKALQERHKDDKPRLQQEMMKLYRDEKVNPLAGCAPTLLQIPIMFALYKVLILTIEMRHQPFVAWIKDLSAPDPLTPVNLFGLLAFTPPHFLAIGVVPILLGISMYFQFKLNPAPMDEVQKQVFAIMPWMMMFLMAPFAVGLQVYWITSNCLTMLQQWVLYRQHPQLKTAPAK